MGTNLGLARNRPRQLGQAYRPAPMERAHRRWRPLLPAVVGRQVPAAAAARGQHPGQWAARPRPRPRPHHRLRQGRQAGRTGGRWTRGHSHHHRRRCRPSGHVAPTGMPLRLSMSRMAMHLAASLCRSPLDLRRWRRQQWQHQQSRLGVGPSLSLGASKRLGPRHPHHSPRRWRACHDQPGSDGGWTVTAMQMARPTRKTRRFGPPLQSLWPPQLSRRGRLGSGGGSTSTVTPMTTTVATVATAATAARMMMGKVVVTLTVALPPTPVPSVAAPPPQRPGRRATSRCPSHVRPLAGRRRVVDAATLPLPTPPQRSPQRRLVCRRGRRRRRRRVALHHLRPTPPRWEGG